MLTDTHCHLDFNAFELDRLSVLDRSKKSGVGRILNPGIDIKSSLAAIDLAGIHPEVFCAVGIHPNSVINWSSLEIDRVKQFATHKKVVAIGEIGLDFYRDITPRDVQIQAFCDQLNIAASLELPIIIHNRQATDEIISIVSNWITDLEKKGNSLREKPGVFHSWSGNLSEAERVIENKFKIGLSGPVTFRKSDELQRIVNALDIEHFLIETDSPFLTPHPFRGKRNEPANVQYIAEKIAEIKNLTLEYVTDKTTQNSIELFNW